METKNSLEELNLSVSDCAAYINELSKCRGTAQIMTQIIQDLSFGDWVAQKMIVLLATHGFQTAIINIAEEIERSTPREEFEKLSEEKSNMLMIEALLKYFNFDHQEEQKTN